MEVPQSLEHVNSEEMGVDGSERDFFLDEDCSRSRHTPPLAISSPFTSPAQSRQPMRQRLDTEETQRIRNSDRLVDNFFEGALSSPLQSVPMSTTTAASPVPPSPSPKPPEDPALNQDRDDETIVSSLSNDEDSLVLAHRTKTLPPIEEVSKEFEFSPPMEVSIPYKETAKKYLSRMEELIAGLALSPPPVVTRGASPQVRRPTLGRNKSCPVAMDFSVSSSNQSKSSRSICSSIPEDRIIVNGNVVEGVRYRDADLILSSPIDPSTAAFLGDRKRRVHRRIYSGTEISVGSIVGQSTLLTATTTSGTSHTASSDASSVRKALQSAEAAKELLQDHTGASDGIACCQVRRPKNIVKEELKFVVGTLTSPIRKLPMFKEKQAQLKRAKGSLV